MLPGQGRPEQLLFVLTFFVRERERLPAMGVGVAVLGGASPQKSEALHRQWTRVLGDTVLSTQDVDTVSCLGPVEHAHAFQGPVR